MNTELGEQSTSDVPFNTINVHGPPAFAGVTPLVVASAQLRTNRFFSQSEPVRAAWRQSASSSDAVGV